VSGLTVIGLAIVTVASAVFVLFATEIAVTVTAAVLGTALGAVYNPVPEIVPFVASPPLTPLTYQVTSLVVAFETLAVNCVVVETTTVTVDGEIETDAVELSTDELPLPPHEQRTNSAMTVKIE